MSNAPKSQPRKTAKTVTDGVTDRPIEILTQAVASVISRELGPIRSGLTDLIAVLRENQAERLSPNATGGAAPAQDQERHSPLEPIAPNAGLMEELAKKPFVKWTAQDWDLARDLGMKIDATGALLHYIERERERQAPRTATEAANRQGEAIGATQTSGTCTHDIACNSCTPVPVGKGPSPVDRALMDLEAIAERLLGSMERLHLAVAPVLDLTRPYPNLSDCAQQPLADLNGKMSEAESPLVQRLKRISRLLNILGNGIESTRDGLTL